MTYRFCLERNQNCTLLNHNFLLQHFHTLGSQKRRLHRHHQLQYSQASMLGHKLHHLFCKPMRYLLYILHKNLLEDYRCYGSLNKCCRLRCFKCQHKLGMKSRTYIQFQLPAQIHFLLTGKLHFSLHRDHMFYNLHRS